MKLDFENATDPFAGLPDISEVGQLREDDRRCLEELRMVLHLHGKQSQFGVIRLHGHFSLKPNEVLIEECDEAARTLTVKPHDKNQVVADDVIETQWRLDTKEAVMGCSQYCIKQGSSHTTHHAGSPGISTE